MLVKCAGMGPSVWPKNRELFMLALHRSTCAGNRRLCRRIVSRVCFRELNVPFACQRRVLSGVTPLDF